MTSPRVAADIALVVRANMAAAAGDAVAGAALAAAADGGGAVAPAGSGISVTAVLAGCAVPVWERAAMRGQTDSVGTLPRDGYGCVVVEATGGPFVMTLSTSGFTLPPAKPFLSARVGDGDAQPTELCFGDAGPFESDWTARADAMCPGEAATRAYWLSFDRRTGVAAFGVGRVPGLAPRLVVVDRSGHRHVDGVRHVGLGNLARPVRLRVLGIDVAATLGCAYQLGQARSAGLPFTSLSVASDLRRCVQVGAADGGVSQRTALETGTQASLDAEEDTRGGGAPSWLRSLRDAQAVLMSSPLGAYFEALPLPLPATEATERMGAGALSRDAPVRITLCEFANDSTMSVTAVPREGPGSEGKAGGEDARREGLGDGDGKADDESHVPLEWRDKLSQLQSSTRHTLSSAPWTLFHARAAGVCASMGVVALRPATTAQCEAAASWTAALQREAGVQNCAADAAGAVVAPVCGDCDDEGAPQLGALDSAATVGVDGASSGGATPTETLFYIRLAAQHVPFGRGNVIQRAVGETARAMVNALSSFGVIELSPPCLALFSASELRDGASLLDTK